MTEDEAERAVANLIDCPVGMDRLFRLVEMISSENERQNLIARSTVGQIWKRHVLDSVQLLRWAPKKWSRWLDIGSGGGFPGLAIACAKPERLVTLVEPRRLRADFLKRAAEALMLKNVNVVQAKVERLNQLADVISARAVAMPSRVLQDASGSSADTTTWLLPTGRLSTIEYDAICSSNPGMMFHVEQSLSDACSSILVGQGRSR